MPYYNTAIYKRLQRVLCCLCSYTAHTTKQHTGLCKRFSCDSSRSTAHDTRPTKAAIIPPAPRWSISQRRSTSSEYQYQRHAGRYTGQHIRPIIIMYIRGAQTMPARRGQLLPSVDCWQVLHPAHLLRGQRLHLCRVSPAACDLAPGQRSWRTG